MNEKELEQYYESYRTRPIDSVVRDMEQGFMVQEPQGEEENGEE